jgi:hypothetical protein
MTMVECLLRLNMAAAGWPFYRKLWLVEIHTSIDSARASVYRGAQPVRVEAVRLSAQAFREHLQEREER